MTRLQGSSHPGTSDISYIGHIPLQCTVLWCVPSIVCFLSSTVTDQQHLEQHSESIYTMSKPDVLIPFIDEKNSPGKATITGKDKSVALRKKPTEKPKESVKSSKPVTSRISASSTDKSRESKLTSRNVTKPNQSSIDPSHSKSPTKLLPEKSKLGVRPRSAPEKVSRTSKIQRPTSTSGGPVTANTAPQRSKRSGDNSAKDTEKAKANTVANKSKAINRTGTTTSSGRTVNKTTTKQVSNNKVDSKSKIKEPHQQQTPNNADSKKCLVEKSPMDITAKLGGRSSFLGFRCEVLVP